MKTVSIIGMIYKSVKYFNFMMDQLKRYGISNNYKIKYEIIANDASDDVLNAIQKANVWYNPYHDKNIDDYYLNRVYRAWNYGGFNAEGDIIVFVNSDMAYSYGWLDNLLSALDKNTIPCSRLVESGKMKSGKYGISKNFGRTVDKYNEMKFINFSNEINDNVYNDGGLFMPCAFYKDDFIKSGGYPEGNVGKISGDKYFFYHNKVMKNKNHITVFDSVVYHFQTGEMDA